MIHKIILLGALWFGMLPSSESTDIRWSSPVLWESSDLEVAKEITYMNLAIEVRSPCEIIDPSLYDAAMMRSARQVCDQLFEETMDRLGSLINSPMVRSPSNNWNDIGMKTDHHIKKRSIIAGVVVGVVGLLVTNTYMSYNAMSKANENELQIGAMKQKIKHMKAGIEHLERNFAKMVTRYDQDMERINSVFNYTAIMNHVSRKAALALHRMEDAVLQSREKWRMSESSEFFFQVFQVDTLGLGDKIASGRHLGIAFDRQTNTVNIAFTVPVTDPDLFVQKAVPVTLMRYEKHETCSYKYSGVEYAIINRNQSCVMPLQQLSKHGSRVLMIPVLACMTPANVSSNLNHYKKDSCHPTSPNDADSYFFQHILFDKILIYCPTQQIEIGSITRDCPMGSAFELPVKQSFKIGEFEHIFKVQNVSMRQKYDTERTVAINHVYQPLAKDLDMSPVLPSYFDDFTEAVTDHWQIMALVFACLFVVILLKSVFACCYRRYKTKGKVHLTPTQMHLMNL